MGDFEKGDPRMRMAGVEEEREKFDNGIQKNRQYKEEPRQPFLILEALPSFSILSFLWTCSLVYWRSKSIFGDDDDSLQSMAS